MSDVAELFGVSYGTVRNWIRRGELPAIRLPGARGIVRIATKDVEALIHRHSVGLDSVDEDSDLSLLDGEMSS